MKGEKASCMLLVAMLILGMSMVSLASETQTPKLFVDPPTYTAALLGEVFTINISIANVTDLGSLEFKLGYNTTLLDAQDAAVGSFFTDAYFTAEIHEPEGFVWVYVECSSTDGNGTLAAITFEATYAGSASCTLDLYETALYEASPPINPIDHEVEDGNYTFLILDLTVATNEPYYLPAENVTIHGNLTQNGSPHQGLVALEVDNPANSPIVVRTIQIGPTPPPGEITVLEVVPCSQWGTPKESFERNATQVQNLFYVKVTVKNNGEEEKNVAVIANSYDVNMVPLGVTGTKIVPLYPDEMASPVMSIPIKEWASLGNGTVYANAFTDWPGRGLHGDHHLKGIPFGPEKSAPFNITDGGQGAGAPGAQTSGNNFTAGNYNLTFKLANDTTATKTGLYRLYAVSSYRGQTVANSTVFGVNAIYVPDHYSTIQGAVDAASPTNNSILVISGTYNEHVTINKSLTLVGMHPSNIIINGSGTGTVVTVAAADNVEISRFTVQNSGSSFPDSGVTLNNSSSCTISENTVLVNHNGVYLKNSSQNNNIIDNTITSNSGYGIDIHSSDNNDIDYNTLSSNNYGIYLNHSTGITLEARAGVGGHNTLTGNEYNFGVFGDSISDFTHDIDASNTVDEKPIIYWINKYNQQVPSDAGFVAVVASTNITVRDLDLTKNGQGVLFAFTFDSFIEGGVNTTSNEYGIHLVNSYNNTITGSEVSNNKYGICLYNSGSNSLHARNKVIYNDVGIKLVSSNDNAIYHNDFINNTQQVYNYSSANTWDDSVGKGNYWSDYTGVDDGSGNRTADDGVGDTLLPHQGVDWYPLMNPGILVHDVAVTSIELEIPYNSSRVYPYWKMNVTVTVKNEGDFTDSFNVTAYYNASYLDKKSDITLTPHTETSIEFEWDTKGVSPGNYTISSNATLTIATDGDPGDNTYIYTDGWGITMFGDVNDDGMVNIGDVKLVKLAYSGYIEDPMTDMNGDFMINIGDLKIVKLIYSGYTVE